MVISRRVAPAPVPGVLTSRRDRTIIACSIQTEAAKRIRIFPRPLGTDGLHLCHGHLGRALITAIFPFDGCHAQVLLSMCHSHPRLCNVILSAAKDLILTTHNYPLFYAGWHRQANEVSLGVVIFISTGGSHRVCEVDGELEISHNSQLTTIHSFMPGAMPTLSPCCARRSRCVGMFEATSAMLKPLPSLPLPAYIVELPLYIVAL
jgi:hypothetical protein